MLHQVPFASIHWFILSPRWTHGYPFPIWRVEVSDPQPQGCIRWQPGIIASKPALLLPQLKVSHNSHVRTRLCLSWIFHCAVLQVFFRQSFSASCLGTEHAVQVVWIPQVWDTQVPCYQTAEGKKITIAWIVGPYHSFHWRLYHRCTPQSSSQHYIWSQRSSKSTHWVR